MSLSNTFLHHKTVPQYFVRNISPRTLMSKQLIFLSFLCCYLFLFICKEYNLPNRFLEKQFGIIYCIFYRVNNCYLIQHCVKSVQIRSFFWSVFSCIRTRKNSIFGHFSRSAVYATSLFIQPLKVSEDQRFPDVFRGYKKREQFA